MIEASFTRSLARTSLSLACVELLRDRSLLGFVPKGFDLWILLKVRDALLASRPKVHGAFLLNVPRARNFEQPG
jgi:hypothetical protein